MCLTIVLIPILFLMLLLLVPIDLEGRVILGKRLKIRAIWLFGLIRKDLFNETRAAKVASSEELEKLQREAAQKPAGTPEKESERNGHALGAGDVLSILQTKGLIGNLKLLLKGLAHALRIRRLRAHIRMGFEDPADTGQAAGYLWSATGYLESLYPIDVKIEPSFYEEALEGEGEGAIRVWPALVLLPLLRFALSRPTLEAAWKVIKIYRNKK